MGWLYFLLQKLGIKLSQKKEMERKTIIISFTIGIVGTIVATTLIYNFSTGNSLFGKKSSIDYRLQNPSRFQKVTDFSETTKNWRKEFWSNEIKRYEREISKHAETYEKVKYLRKTIKKTHKNLHIITNTQKFRNEFWTDKLFIEFRHQVDKIIDSYEYKGAHFKSLSMKNPKAITLTFLRGPVEGPLVKSFVVEVQTTRHAHLKEIKHAEGE